MIKAWGFVFGGRVFYFSFFYPGGGFSFFGKGGALPKNALQNKKRGIVFKFRAIRVF